MVTADECEYGGICPVSGKHIIREYLTPSSRGWIVHEFGSEKAALKWLAKLEPTRLSPKKS